LALAFFVSLGGHLEARPRRIHPELARAFERDGKAVVTIALRSDCLPGEPLARRCLRYGKAQEQLLSSLGPGNYRLRYRYRFSPVLVVEVAGASLLKRLEESPAVELLSADPAGSGGLEESRELIRAGAVHDLGIRGEGRVIAVLDSGVDSDHPDLRDAIVHQYHFLERGTETGPGAEDEHGHGTHVASIAVSRGHVAPRGIAPRAQLVAIRVLNSSNRGFLSDWAAGVEHVIALHLADNGIRIDAINMSLVSDAQYPGLCDNEYPAFSMACSAARELGIAIFAASGNNGSLTQLTAPACFESTISVGAVEDLYPDAICWFTSRNVHLDLLAPGKFIVGAGLGGGVSPPRQGTSQATPHAAALACLLRELHPGIEPVEILELLESTGVPVHDDLTGLTFPRIDALSAVSALLLPRVRAFTCRQSARASDIELSWEPLAGVGHFILRTIRDGELLGDRPLAGTSSAYSLAVPGSGAYDLCLTPYRERQRGPSSCCRVVVSGNGGFLRGNCNGDSRIDIADPLLLLRYLFSEGARVPPCFKACDANDDGKLELTDAIYALGALFLGTSQPPPPYPSCGADPEPDELSCEHPSC
jgi:subtilisin family serine protease